MKHQDQSALAFVITIILITLIFYVGVKEEVIGKAYKMPIAYEPTFKEIPEEPEPVMEPIVQELPIPPISPPPDVESKPVSEPSKTTYIYAGNAMAEFDGTELKYYHTDNLGSTRVVTNEEAEVVYYQNYMPFGEQMNNNEDFVDYTGKKLDEETELYYLGARYYNPKIGRFTQVDPISDALSPYAYVRNNPYVFTDPNGAEPAAANPVGSEIHRWAQEQIPKSAFVGRGRGPVYYDYDTSGKLVEKPSPGGVLSYDCIGLIIVALAKYYEKPLSEFPPDLRLIDKLAEYGWTSQVIPPASKVGSKVTEEAVKNIPEGSIVFLMHPVAMETQEDEPILIGDSFIAPLRSASRSETETQEFRERIMGGMGVGYAVVGSDTLKLGHSLIKSEGIGFINAIPDLSSPEEMPAAAIAYNKQREEQGMGNFYWGPVREAGFVPQDDYLFAISPQSK